MQRECNHCHFLVSISADRCPHCHESLDPPPNVWVASQPDEQAALSLKHESVTQTAKNQGSGDRLAEFEAAVTDQSFAVICRDLGEVQRIAHSDSEIYRNYYKLLDAGLRLPNTSDEWNLKREQADIALFFGFQKKMHHAVLTLDYGMSYYGECHLQLNSQLIARRSTVFWENSAEFYASHAKPGERPFSGFRAVWQDRGKLAAAKLGGKIHAKVTAERFAGILRQDGKKPGEEKFIEVHVFGDLTIRSTQMVMLKPGGDACRYRALKESLAKMGVPLKELAA